MVMRLAPLWNEAHKLVTSHFQYTPGIQAAPVVDRKNARVGIVDRRSGFMMPNFEIVMERLVAPASLRCLFSLLV